MARRSSSRVQARRLPDSRLIRRPNRGVGWVADRGLFEVPDDFDAPLPEDVVESFER